ncbi:MAG: radical SAM protein, partial [Planctomycetota bacterium]
DSEPPAILRAARDAGATSAGYVLLRLPTTVREVFLDWLTKLQPTRRERVESFVRSTQGGRLYRSEFGVRMRGEGEYAGQIAKTFGVFARRLGFVDPPPPSGAAFRPPEAGGQRRLF